MAASPTEINIPPPKGFEILEPEKVTDNLLITIEDTNSNPHINTLLLKNNHEFNLIDVYENIFVNPQHVKIKNNELKNAEKSNIFNVRDEELTKFFDKLEAGEKIDINTDDRKESNKKFETKHKSEVLSKGTLNPKAVDAVEDSDPEDLINEIIFTKINDKRILEQNGVIKIQDKSKNFNTSNCIKKSRNIDNVAATDINTDLVDIKTIKVLKTPVFDNILITKENSATKNISSTSKTAKLFCANPKKLSEKLMTGNNSHENLIITDKSNAIDSLIDIVDWSNIVKATYKYSGNITLPPYSKETYSLNSNNYNAYLDFESKFFKKDEKLYRKKRVIIPESIKKNYTRAANFDEKYRVLPQIMARLGENQMRIDAYALNKKRFILDSGQPVTSLNCVKSKNENVSLSNSKNGSVPFDSCFGKLSPVILTLDHNKERLEDLKKSKKFIDFVKHK